MFRNSITLLAAALVASSATATTLNTAQLSVAPNFAGGSGPYSGLDNQYGPASLAGSGSGGGNSIGAGTVFVNWGVVKLTGNAAGSLNTLARGTFRDELVVTAPGVPNGTPGVLTFAIYVDGALSVGDAGGAAARWALSADVNGGTFDLQAGGSRNRGLQGGQYVGTPFGYFTGTASFGFGSTLPLYVELEGIAQAAYQQDFALANAAFDLGQSLYWGGITSVTVGGAPVSGYAVGSASGTDYLNSMVPVPEPGALALMLAGLALVAGLQRRRQRG